MRPVAAQVLGQQPGLDVRHQAQRGFATGEGVRDLLLLAVPEGV